MECTDWLRVTGLSKLCLKMLLCLCGMKSGLPKLCAGVGVRTDGGSSDPLLSNKAFMIDSVRAGRW